MTTPLVQSISDEVLADLAFYASQPGFEENESAQIDIGELRGLIARLRAAEADAQDLREKLRSANASLEASYGYCKQYRERMESAEDKLSAIRTFMERHP